MSNELLQDNQEFNLSIFESQNVLTIDSNLVCLTNDEKLMIGCPSAKCIKIYDLNGQSMVNDNNNLTTKIPLEHDGLMQIVYCQTGNYIATFSCSLNQIKYVCVYVNWWVTGHSIRFREDGMSLTGLNADENGYHTKGITMEVIEFMSNALVCSNAVNIDCCQANGNLIICCGFDSLIYQFKSVESTIKTNEFHCDFIKMIDIRTKLLNTKAFLSENYVLFLAKNHVSLIRLSIENFGQENGHVNGHVNDNSNEENHKQENRFTIDVCIEWDFKEPTVKLPTLINEIPKSKKLFHPEEVFGPASDEIACKYHYELAKGFRHLRVQIEIIHCKYFVSQKIVNAILYPIYEQDISSNDPLNASKLLHGHEEVRKKSILKSNENLLSIGVCVATKTKCFIYKFKDESYECLHQINLNNINEIAMNDFMVYIINEKLQTFAHELIENQFKIKSHRSSKNLLLNSSNFFNLESVFSSNNYLILLTSMEKRTLYSLKLSSAKRIYHEAIETIDDLNDLDQRIALLSYLNKILYHIKYKNDDNLFLKCSMKLCHNLIQRQEFEPASDIIKVNQLNINDLVVNNFDPNFITEFVHHQHAHNIT